MAAMEASSATALAAVAALAAAHVLASRLRFLEGIPRHWLLSAFGGISVAYAVVHLLPEVAEADEALSESAEGILPFLDRHAYLVVLAGLAVFYGLEHLAMRSRSSHSRQQADETPPGVFAVSVASFGVYNALVGYLMVRRADEQPAADLALFATALGVHFVVNDFGLREHHKRRYQHVGRWLLSASILVGWATGALVEVSAASVGLILSFLAGGVILNVLKEELPEERQSRLLPLVGGMVGYTALLLAV